MRLPYDLLNVVGGESVIWSGKPKMQPFVIRNLVGLLIPFMIMIPLCIIATQDSYIIPILIYFLIVDFILFLAFAIYPVLVWRNTYYVITDHRAIIRKGVIGIDYDVLKLELIQAVNVNVGIWDRSYDTGTNIIQAVGIDPIKLENVDNPMEVRNIIERQSKDHIRF